MPLTQHALLNQQSSIAQMMRNPWPQSLAVISGNHASEIMGTIDRAPPTSDPPHEHATIDQRETQCNGTTTLVIATPHALTICPTRIDHLDNTLDRLHDSIARLANQSVQYYAMMAKTNAQILEDLQQLEQLLPQFLATLSKYIPAPVHTRLMTPCHPKKVNTYTPTKKPSWLPPKLYLRSVPTPLTPHLKSVRFKTHAPCSCIKLLSWPNDMRPP